MRKSRVFIALLHHPMYNKRGDIITTSITNLDLHDISRVARTYDVEGFYVVHPSENQHQLLQEIVHYWSDGYGGEYNPDRKDAFHSLKPVKQMEQVMEDIQSITGKMPLTVATDAKVYPNTITYSELKRKIYDEEQTFLILFGTGWGMSKDSVQKCDYILDPVGEVSDYNHLSVRSAVSIILDRLLGEFWFNK